MKSCPNCNCPLDKDYNYCPSCGFDLKSHGENNSEKGEIEELKRYIICDVCGEEVSEDSEFCISCGAKITGREKTAEKKEVKPLLEQPPVGNKPVSKERVPVQKPQKNKQQSQPVKKSVQQKSSQQKTAAGTGKKVSPVQLAVMVAGLLAFGALIMWGAGVFGSGQSENVSNIPQQQLPQQEEAPAVSLENVQRINELEAAVKRDSTNLNTVLELAHLLNDSGMKERSVPYYLMYLRSNSRDADVQVDLGVVYYEMQQFDMAKNRMRKGLVINPMHQKANFNLGIINLAAGNIDSAKVWWKKALEIDPTSEVGKTAKELLDSHK